MLPKECPKYLDQAAMLQLTKTHLGTAVTWDGTERVALLYVVTLASEWDRVKDMVMRATFVQEALATLLHEVRMDVSHTFAIV